jgi:hypothetical protein
MAGLCLRKEPLVPILIGGWVGPELVWKMWREEKSLPYHAKLKFSITEKYHSAENLIPYKLMVNVNCCEILGGLFRDIRFFFIIIAI